ncbi:MAG: SufD family Fe-S cluster assembly protein [Bacteroidales bacterium]|nr:SufD family Fe-S cluster assembly protein [Bacteroidales bacterium]
MGHGRYIDPFVIPGEAGEFHTVRAGEHLALEYLVLPGESRDINVSVDLVGEGANLEIKALYLSGADEKVRIRTLVHHRVKGCTSRQLIKGIASGNADVRFDGVIIVAPGADGTEALQENHNILLSEQAKVETLPQLEIYADDVKCSHGATVGRLGEEELFYMRSRGIPEKEARVLQMLSFISPVIPEGRENEISAELMKL